MLTLNKISCLLKEQKKTQKDLCEYLGLTKNTYTEWKSGRSESYLKYISQIAEFLGVSADYLLKGEDISDENSNLKFALWGGDAEIIDDEMIEDVKAFAKMIAERKKQKMSGNNDK